MGRRVVVAKTLHDDAAADENFGWRSRPALAPAAVWRALEAVTADEVAAVRDRAREELSAQRMLARELELLATLEPAPAGASGALAHAEALADARWGGARRLPRPLDRPDRAVLLLRDHGRPGW